MSSTPGEQSQQQQQKKKPMPRKTIKGWKVVQQTAGLNTADKDKGGGEGNVSGPSGAGSSSLPVSKLSKRKSMAPSMLSVTRSLQQASHSQDKKEVYGGIGSDGVGDGSSSNTYSHGNGNSNGTTTTNNNNMTMTVNNESNFSSPIDNLQLQHHPLTSPGSGLSKLFQKIDSNSNFQASSYDASNMNMSNMNMNMGISSMRSSILSHSSAEDYSQGYYMTEDSIPLPPRMMNGNGSVLSSATGTIYTSYNGGGGNNSNHNTLSVMIPQHDSNGSNTTDAIEKIDSDTVTVAVRVRPLNKVEIEENNTAVFATKVEGKNEYIIELTEDGKQTKRDWPFDFVYGPEAPTQTIFESMGQLIVDKSMEGYNGTIFAYGQTSSGKTHTLMGNNEAPGLTWLALQHIFNRVRTSESEYLIRLSYLEIYNEDIIDLLLPSTSKVEKLRIVDEKSGAVVKGLNEVIITSFEQVSDLIKFGESNRHYGSTSMNEKSSRSHVLFRLVIESQKPTENQISCPTPKPNWEDTKKKGIRYSTLYLVDLAGSERQKKTLTSGTRLAEGNAINKSLLALGNVIQKLSENNGEYISYRDSTLTRLLSSSLGGNAKTAMISAISPADRNREETSSTLRYASRVKKIINKAEVNEIADTESLLATYKQEIEGLKRQLQTAVSSSTAVNELEEERKAEAEAALEAKERLAQLSKLILVSKYMKKRALKIGGIGSPRGGGDNNNNHLDNDLHSEEEKALLASKEKAKRLEKDLLMITRGRRRAGSVFAQYSKDVSELGLMGLTDGKGFGLKMKGGVLSSTLADAAGVLNRTNDKGGEGGDQLSSEEENLIDPVVAEVLDGESIDEVELLREERDTFYKENQTFKEKLIQLKDENEEMKNAIKTISYQKGKLEKEFVEANNKREKLNTDLIKTKNDLQLLNEQFTEQTIDFTKEKNRSQRASKDLDELKVSSEEEINSILLENKDLLTSLENVNIEKSSYMKELSHYKVLYQGLLEEHESLKSRSSEESITLNKQIKDMKVEHMNMVTTSEKKVSNLQRDNDNLSIDLEKYTTLYNTAMNENTNTKSKLTNYVVLLEESERGRQEAEQELNNLKISSISKEKELTHKINLLSTELSESQTTCSSFHQQRDELNTEVNKLTNKCTDLTTKYAEMERIKTEELVTTTRSKDKIIETLEISQLQLQKSKESLESECESLKKDVEDSHVERDEISQRLSETETNLSMTTFEKEDTITQLTTKLEVLEKKGMDLQEDNERLRIDSKEKIRLSVEVESSNRKIDLLSKDNSRMEDIVTTLKAQTVHNNKENRALAREKQAYQDENLTYKHRVEYLEQQLAGADESKQTLLKENESLSRELDDIVVEREGLYNKISTLTQNLQDFKEEKKALQIHLKSLEEEIVKHQKVGENEKRNNTTLQDEIELLKDHSADLVRCKKTMSTLQEEVEKAVKRATELDKLLSQAHTELDEIRFREKKMNVELQSHRQRYDNLKLELNETKESLTREISVSSDRNEALLATEERAESAQRRLQSLEKQLNEVTEQYLSTLGEKRNVEESVLKFRSTSSQLEEALERLQSEAAKKDEEIARWKENEHLTEEVTILRKQLAAVRCTMLESSILNDTDDEDGEWLEKLDSNSTMTSISNRISKGLNRKLASVQEESKRQITLLENIVTSLRSELEEQAESKRELQERMKVLSDQATQGHIYQEEVDLLMKRCKSAEESKDRIEQEIENIRQQLLACSQERDAAAREALRTKDDFNLLQQELTFSQQNYTKEKNKADTLASTTNELERKALEAITNANRLAVALDEIRHNSRSKDLDFALTIQDRDESSEKLTQLQQDYVTLLDSFNSTKTLLEHTTNEKCNLTKELKSHEVSIESYAQQIQTLKNSVKETEAYTSKLSQEYNEKEGENKKLVCELLQMQKDVDRFRNEYEKSIGAKCSKELEDIRLELDHTVSDWEKAESARRMKESNVGKLKTQLATQMERNTLLKAQVSLLEEQINNLTEELAIYRQLEVYNTTLQHEFQSLRDKRRLSKKNPYRMTTTTTNIADSESNIIESKYNNNSLLSSSYSIAKDNNRLPIASKTGQKGHHHYQAKNTNLTYQSSFFSPSRPRSSSAKFSSSMINQPYTSPIPSKKEIEELRGINQNTLVKNLSPERVRYTSSQEDENRNNVHVQAPNSTSGFLATLASPPRSSEYTNAYIALSSPNSNVSERYTQSKSSLYVQDYGNMDKDESRGDDKKGDTFKVKQTNRLLLHSKRRLSEQVAIDTIEEGRSSTDRNPTVNSENKNDGKSSTSNTASNTGGNKLLLRHLEGREREAK